MRFVNLLFPLSLLGCCWEVRCLVRLSLISCLKDPQFLSETREKEASEVRQESALLGLFALGL